MMNDQYTHWDYKYFPAHIFHVIQCIKINIFTITIHKLTFYFTLHYLFESSSRVCLAGLTLCEQKVPTKNLLSNPTFSS